MPIDPLGARMKEFYEKIPQTKLTRRIPVAIRLDGKAFHTFTRGFDKPIDQILRKSMNETMLYLCQNVQGCVFGYCQSDEITLILTDYKKLTSEAWFDYKVQKVCSVSASMATMVFNSIFTVLSWNDVKYTRVRGKALFDSRCFNIPKEEVANLILWRQQDATRNSINSAGQLYFSHKQLQHKNTDQVQEMLFSEKGINWNDYSTEFKRGVACTKENGSWIIDKEMPIIKGENRNYVERFLEPEE